jgi:formamidopyrimidine-DNA glycosylase
MPELPEVETVKRVLEPQLSGRKILSAEIRRPQIVPHPDAASLCESVIGHTVVGMGRRGKFIETIMDDGSVMVVHLRMTGQLYVAPLTFPEEKHTHAVFRLDDEKELRFVDQRRFGRIWLIAHGEEDDFTGIGDLGPEPNDPAMNAEYLKATVGRRSTAIKTCLLDQSVVAGIGNIYSDEILFVAGISPERPSDSLSTGEWNRLAKAIPERLEFFTEKNAITAEDYLEGRGTDYRNTPFLNVYGCEGEPCRKCGRLIERTVINGRSAHFCPKCQK